MESLASSGSKSKKNWCRLFGKWISSSSSSSSYEEESTADDEKVDNGETVVEKKKRSYTRRLPKGPPSEEEKTWSYKDNIGELLVEKSLTTSDVDQSCRLLLPKNTVLLNILPILKLNNPQAEEQCKSKAGVGIDIFDADDDDTGNKFYNLKLKQWETKSYVLAGNWRRDFVNRRNLKEDDQIGLFWNQTQSRFYFSVKRNRHS